MGILNKIFKKEGEEVKKEATRRVYFKKRLVCFRIDPELWEKLKTLGIQKRKTASEIVREMIENYVKNES